MAPAASLPNCRGGTSPARHAATPSTNALDPLMSVRSRSKNAALGPLDRYWLTSESSASDIATHCQRQVVHAPLRNLELTDHDLDCILASMPDKRVLQRAAYLVVGDFRARRRALQDDRVFTS